MNVCAEQEGLLHRIQEIEFMGVELNLYLDTHPGDQRALCEYNNYSRQLRALKEQYERMYGPLCGFGFSPSQYPWRWIMEPWPWDKMGEGREEMNNVDL